METTNRQLVTVISRWDQRLRFTQLAIWLPRGLAAGLSLGLVVAMISRLRPWLQSQQILTVTLIAVSIGVVLTALGVLTWPRSMMQKARFFDRLFDLKERSTTALELRNGLIKAPVSFATVQAQDAVAQANSINARRYLTVRWRSNELLGVLGLIVALLISFVVINPQNSILAEQQNLNLAVSEQAQRLQKIEQGIQDDSALSSTDKAELSKIAQDAINQLQQANVTLPEALAALTRAAQDLNNTKTQLTAQQLAAGQNAARSLDGTQATQGAAQSLAAGNLSAAASQLQDLAQKVASGQLTSQQLSDISKALGQAADNLTAMNAAAADALKQAAEALKNGDTAQAQKELNAAAQALQQQQQQNDSTPRSQAAQKAAQQANQGKSALSNLKPASSNSGQNSPSGQNASQQSDSQQNQQQGSQGANQDGSQSQQGQADKPSGSNGAQPDNQSGGALQAADSPNQGQTKPLTNADQNAGGGDPVSSGVSQNALPGAGQSNPVNSASQQSGSQGDGGLGAGQGQGGAGNDITQGASNNAPGSGFDTNNGRGDGSVVPYERVYAPSFIGGKGGDPLNLKSGSDQSNSTDPSSVGDVGPSSAGLSTVPLSSVSAQAAGEADVAMDADHVPGALRGVIRDYFTSLQNH